MRLQKATATIFSRIIILDMIWNIEAVLRLPSGLADGRRVKRIIIPEHHLGNGIT